ncbi:PucR family transcriptional regulator [Nonomuraea sp. KC401]|uniref:helix-turn-helix domain-containing protein n=1 Tax=unclassified Nonomuraea TaxID=2593643 RepID=UPI0010FD9CD6|nr:MULTISPECIES: helix-turn-helix domain-containing protein [unclassified Nonomuraea]NBE91878.1 PucR family transcriptional regulator [Nonomuraea sp. K271]TLF75520.1 PucR family transcriptional regulator [Nonomuraea sp. KC401]
MPTLSGLVSRPGLGLRFVDPEDAVRHGGRPVAAVAEGMWAAGAGAPVHALNDVLLVLPAGAGIDWPAVESAAGVVLAGAVEDDVLSASLPAAREHGVPLLIALDDAPHFCAGIHPVIRREQRRELHERTDQLKAMQRIALRPDGLSRLLRWLARQISGHAMLVDPSGSPLYAYPRSSEEIFSRAEKDIRRVITKQTRSAAISLGTQVAHIMSIGSQEPNPVLIVARDEPFSSDVRSLVSDAAGLLWLRWRMEELGRHSRQVEQAESHSREAVLHLLMLGQVQSAKRVAGALPGRLPDPTRVYIVESPANRRAHYARTCAEATGGRAWIVACPVYVGHLIILAPADSQDNPLDQALRSLVASNPGCYAGAGRLVRLRDIAAGYQQAFHALAVARGIDARCATYSSREDIASLLGARGHRWAARSLSRLLDHRPERPQDPDAEELKETLTSWLAFFNAATRQLKIHRNTLSARLRHIERLLGCDLNDLAVQAETQLALRLLAQPSQPGNDESGDVTLDALLDTPAVFHWAESYLTPLNESDPCLLETLRTWLRSNARLDATASMLGLTVPAVRKRLVRVEGILSRSLLNGPSARHDAVLAFRILDSVGPS